MKEKITKIEWQDDDVIAFSDENIIKASEIMEVIQEAATDNNALSRNIKIALGKRLNLSQQVQNINHRKWFEDGVDCKIMRVYDAKGWQKGKIRIKLSVELELLEETDQSNSPLDNFRETEE